MVGVLLLLTLSVMFIMALARVTSKTNVGLSLIKKGMIMVRDNRGNVAGGILAGIMVMIIGLATLVLGNYIVFAIISAVPVITGTYAANYTSNLNTIIGYVTTIIPLFGLALMVLGFGIILYTLRASMQSQDAR